MASALDRDLHFMEAALLYAASEAMRMHRSETRGRWLPKERPHGLSGTPSASRNCTDTSFPRRIGTTPCRFGSYVRAEINRSVPRQRFGLFVSDIGPQAMPDTLRNTNSAPDETEEA